MARITCDNRRRIDFQELLLVVRDALCVHLAPGRIAPDTGLVLPSLCSRRIHGGVVPAALYLHVVHSGPRPAFRLADHRSILADGDHHRGGEPEPHAPGNAHLRGLAGSVRPREVTVSPGAGWPTQPSFVWVGQFDLAYIRFRPRHHCTALTQRFAK